MEKKDPPGRRILIIDDEPLMGRTLVRHFQRQGGFARVAPSLAEASRAVGEGPWDLILLDISLPDGSGLSLVPLLRKAGAAPILLMTGDFAAPLPEGVRGVIHKPFDLKALESAVRAVLDGR